MFVMLVRGGCGIELRDLRILTEARNILILLKHQDQTLLNDVKHAVLRFLCHACMRTAESQRAAQEAATSMGVSAGTLRTLREKGQELARLQHSEGTLTTHKDSLICRSQQLERAQPDLEEAVAAELAALSQRASEMEEEERDGLRQAMRNVFASARMDADSLLLKEEIIDLLSDSTVLESIPFFSDQSSSIAWLLVQHCLSPPKDELLRSLLQADAQKLGGSSSFLFCWRVQSSVTC